MSNLEELDNVVDLLRLWSHSPIENMIKCITGSRRFSSRALNEILYKTQSPIMIMMVIRFFVTAQKQTLLCMSRWRGEKDKLILKMPN